MLYLDLSTVAPSDLRVLIQNAPATSPAVAVEELLRRLKIIKTLRLFKTFAQNRNRFAHVVFGDDERRR